MGIKGIYKEIGPGKRVSLCKLAVDHLEKTGRLLRIAIDFAVWSFQAQAARGGANPAVRTLFYRLVRLLSLSIVPILVFDGPNKPKFKRNKRSRGPGDSVSVAMAKRLVKLFGFHIHDAPGEAEAECALLQQQGVVDAVLSEDVDTIMFGCTLTLRNWSSEGTRTAKTPTHVSVYDARELGQGESGLDREGLVLVALMSGGDYIPEGVPGCGVKVACEAAKAGFGRRLCRIKRSDQDALSEWRQDLMRELRTNQSKFFRTKHKAVTIPAEFPRMEVLRYYTHPVVSQPETVEALKRRLPARGEVDTAGLRAFAAETFDWVYRIGAVKFIRVLAPGLLNQALMDLSNKQLESDHPDLRERVEAEVVKLIYTRRNHSSTDGTPELRISYIPNDVVGVDLDAEEDEVTSAYGRSGLALNSGDEGDDQAEEAGAGPKKLFDPLQPNLAWVPETVMRLGVPLAVEDWEARQRAKHLAKGARKAPTKKPRKKASDMPTGALDQYVQSTRPIAAAQKPPELSPLLLSSSPAPQLTQTLTDSTSSISRTAGQQEPRHVPIPKKKQPKSRQMKKSKTTATATATELSLGTTPWTIASSQATPRASRIRITTPEAIIISSSPVEIRHLTTITSPSCHKTAGNTIPPNSPTPSIVNDSHGIPPQDDSLDVDCSLASDIRPAEARPGSRKHKCPSDDPLRNPAVKRRQTSTGATKPRSVGPSRRSGHRARAQPTADQASIKNFGRLSETLGRTNIMPTTKPPPPPPPHGVLDSDEDFEELYALCSRRKAAPGAEGGPYLSGGSAVTPDLGLHSNSGNETAPPRTSYNSMDAARKLSSSAAMTKVYLPRTSDVGLGYFTEVEVTRDEADRMVREDSLATPPHRPRRPGGFRVWRQSEVSILDLTGED
ncbi:flap structure-specific endonuclease [Diaporthe helianthi]|uniref:Flap structure-specific endonuclease n=1 Tax=Diaporthe helianthi TaxID=158607 RepID=A0A2P5I5A9_DIAHE|nr:flap structure-specific endonuclease [Diaporthe helianthi]